MAGDGGLGDLESVVLNASDSGFIHFQIESASGQTFAKQDKSRHSACNEHSIILMGGSSQESAFFLGSRLLNQGAKFGEQRFGIMGARRGLRMILHTIDGLGL